MDVGREELSFNCGKTFGPLKNNSLQIHLETSQISTQTQMAKQKKAFCHTRRAGNSFCLHCTFVAAGFSPSSLTWNLSPEWWQTPPLLNPEDPGKPGPVSRPPSMSAQVKTVVT